MCDLGRLLGEAEIPVSEEAVQGLKLYHSMLLDWNTRMDLTSVSQQDMASRHFVDSLLPLKAKDLFPLGARVIDVGTGAGFPGLAIAIARPDCFVTLLEAQGKRCQFLRAVCGEMKIENAEVVQERAEVLGRMEGRRESYDRAIARAVAPLNVLCEYLLPFVRLGGLALCWKGPAAEEEMQDALFASSALGGEMGNIIVMPQGDIRHVVVPVKKIEKTLPQYPRKNGIPTKRPLKSGKK